MEIQDSFFLSLNFEGNEVPTRIELIPAGGVIVGRDGRQWKNTNPQQLAVNSMARLPKLPIDENHSTDLAAPKGGSSPAFGWITSINAEPSGAIFANVEWTPRGQAAMANREYGFLSPVFLSDKKGEITCILRAGLTNTPNLQLPALNSDCSQSLEKPESIDMEVSMKSICAFLGLPETATEADVLAAVKNLNAEKPQTATPPVVDLAAYAPRADLKVAQDRADAAEKQLKVLNAAQLKKDAEAIVDAAIKDRKIAPASREQYLNLCSTQEGLETFKNIAAASPAIISETTAPEGTPPGAGVSLNAEDIQFAKSMGYTEEEFKKIKEGSK